MINFNWILVHECAIYNTAHINYSQNPIGVCRLFFPDVNCQPFF